MPRFSANISMLFCEHDWLDRPAATAAAGFGAVEIQFPYDHAPAEWAAAIEAAGLAVAVFNIPVGDMLDGGPGLAAMPGREADFAEAVEKAVTYVQALKPRCVNVLSGFPPADMDREAGMAALATNLAAAAEAMEPLGVRVVVEAVNTIDRPGFFLDRSAQAIAAVEQAGHPNLGIEYDIYHMHLMEGDVTATIERLLPRIGHIQFADAPGRREPGTGEIDFTEIFAAIDRAGYDGWVGAEYNPSGATADSLDWLAPFR